MKSAARFLLLVLTIGQAVPVPAQAQSEAAPTVISNSGHAFIKSIAFSRDGRLLASSSTDSSIKLWDVASRRLLRTLVGHTKSVASVAISPNGRLVASASDDATMRLWDAESGRLLHTLAHSATQVTSVAFSPDGTVVASGGWDSSVKLWNSLSGQLLRTLPAGTSATFGVNFVTSVAFTPDGLQVLAGTQNGIVMRWDRATGKLIRSLAHSKTEPVSSVGISPDGRMVVSSASDGTAKIWDLVSGRLLHTLAHSAKDSEHKLVQSVAFSPDSRLMASNGNVDGVVKLWDAGTGRLVRSIDAALTSDAAVFSPDGRWLATGSEQPTIELWDVASGALSPTPFGVRKSSTVDIAPVTDGLWLVVGPYGLTRWDAASGQLVKAQARVPGLPAWIGGQFVGTNDEGQLLVATRHADRLAIHIWNATSGSLLRTLEWGPTPEKDKPCPNCTYSMENIEISHDGRWLAAAVWGVNTIIKVWDVSSGRLMHDLAVPSAGYRAAERLVFSLDGRTLAAVTHEKNGEWRYRIRYWDLASGRLVNAITQPEKVGVGSAGGGALAFSPDGRSIATGYMAWGAFGSPGSGYAIGTVAILDATTGQLVRSFRVDKLNNSPRSIKYSPDGNLVAVGVYYSHAVNVWEAATGRFIRTLQGNLGEPRSVAFTPNGQQIVVGNANGTSGVWDTHTGERLIITLHEGSGEWVTMTPEGFFVASSPKAGTSLSIVRGFEALAIEQVYQALFSPDLVREKLAGDPDGEVKKAAAVLDLKKVLNSGQAPQVTLTSPKADAASEDEVVNAQARIVDQGGGIGRIEWRLNGLTVGVTNSAAGDDKERTTERTMALEPGENTIEVVAYNGANLLASRTATATITFNGTADSIKPNLHILAIGINAYADTGWTPPGAADAVVFPKLGLAVKDATTFAAKMKEASVDRYGDVRVTLALDGDATAEALERIIDRLAGEVHPRDTFVLFAAAHGTSENGRFYLIPQDYQGGPDSLAQRGVGQDRLQDWIANRLQAKKVVILLDTCELGALVSGSGRSRTDVPTSEAAIGRLHEATGRPVLTAAAEGKPAFEGFEGHGVFTWTLLDALKNGDRSGNGAIELSELVAHVQDQVPKISAKLNGRGRAAVAARGSADDRQSARFGSRGEDFVLANRLQ